MNNQITPRIEAALKKYSADHKGEVPLFVILSPDDALKLASEIREEHKFAKDVIVTEFQDIKIVKHLAMNKGEIRFSNELPETGS